VSRKQHELYRHVRHAIEGMGAVIVAHRTTGSGHQRFDFEIAGRRGVVIFSSTPSQAKDLKAIACARRVVRRTQARAERRAALG
jgi:hypothetical protein